jgi:hypothetical protein
MHVWAGPLHIPYMPRPRDRETHQMVHAAIGMFRGPFEMDVGDRLEVISFPDVGCGAAVGGGIHSAAWNSLTSSIVIGRFTHDRVTHHCMLRNDFPARLVCSAVHLKWTLEIGWR